MGEAAAETLDSTVGAEATDIFDVVEPAPAAETPVADVVDTSKSISVNHNDSLDPEAEPDTEVEGIEWFFDEGIKGEGERPEYLKEKYKSVADQAKAYNELEKKLGEFTGAPKDGYDLSHIETLNNEDPLLKHFAETFKELNMTQKGFERVIDEFMEVQGATTKLNVQEEMKKLGPSAKAEITQIDTWLNNTLNEETAATVKSWIMTADDVKALQAIKSFQPRSAIPTAADQEFLTSYETLDEVKAEKVQNWDRYNNDTNYRNSLTRRLHEAHARQKRGK